MVVSFRADLNCRDVPNMCAVAGYLLLLTILLLLAFLLLMLGHDSHDMSAAWCLSGCAYYICCC